MDNIVYTKYIPMKDKLLTIKVTQEEKSLLKKLAKEEGHNSVAGFIMWLIHQFKSGKLVRKR
jgi:hypothetical protein